MAAVLTKKRKREDARSGVQFMKAAKPSALNGKRGIHDPSPEPQLALANNADNGGKKVVTALAPVSPDDDVNIQIITGSYDRVLHGIAARIPSKLVYEQQTSVQTNSKPQPNTEGDEANNITFTDTFLFAAHASSIRCLALSPPNEESGKRILATGSSDERINLYSISTTPPPATTLSGPLKSTIPRAPPSTAENPQNTLLGTLTHHTHPLTRLHFPPSTSNTKLFSSSEDNTISITTRKRADWPLLSTLKAPIPKPHGRPSGDTAGPGEIPAGVNDFAIHPSRKLMLSVGKGEKCLRLWNLMTGKKAGVLSFPREVLAQVGEGGRVGGGGEGRRVLWNESGEAYVVGFERSAVIFGIDSKPKAVIKPTPSTKLHEVRFLPNATNPNTAKDILAISTEDGRILFFNTYISSDVDADEDADAEKPTPQNLLPSLPCLAQLGGRAAGISSRIKDFSILQLPSLPSPATEDEEMPLLIITGSSDGRIRIWTLLESDIISQGSSHTVNGKGGVDEMHSSFSSSKQVGRCVGVVETGNRILCLGAFVMDGRAGTYWEEEGEGKNGVGSGDDDGGSDSGIEEEG